MPTAATVLKADVVESATVLRAAEVLAPDLSVNWAFTILTQVKATVITHRAIVVSTPFAKNFTLCDRLRSRRTDTQYCNVGVA